MEPLSPSEVRFEATARAVAGALVPGLPDDDAALARWLAPRVVALSKGLTRERALAGRRYLEEKEALAAYLLYYAPFNAQRARRVLPALPVGARVLDLGCGPGTLLGVLDDPEVELLGLDHVGLAAEVAGELAARLGFLRARFRRARLEPRAVPEGPWDLVFLGYAQNELNGESLALAAAQQLGPEGQLLVLEPGTRAATEGLKRLRETLLAAGFLPRSPCTHVAPCPLPAPRFGWCHQDIAPARSALLRRVDALTGLDKERAALSHLRVARGAGPPNGWRALSPTLRAKGTLTVHVCGPDGAREAVLLQRDRGAANAAFAEVQRGDQLVMAPGRKGESLRLGPETEVVVHRFDAT